MPRPCEGCENYRGMTKPKNGRREPFCKRPEGACDKFSQFAQNIRKDDPDINPDLRRTLEPHPYADLFPMLPASDLEKLAASIRDDGQQQPIVLLDGKILDGRNRYAACQLAGVEPKTVEYEGADPLGFVIALNLTRRHLNESQRAMAAAKIARIKREDTLNQGSRCANLRNGENPDSTAKTQDEAAKLLNVGRRSVQSARAVIEKAAPEIKEAVESGDLSVSVASTLTSLSKDDQSDFAKQGVPFLRKAAAQIRKDARAAKEIEDEPEDPREAAMDCLRKAVARHYQGFSADQMWSIVTDVLNEVYPQS